MANRQRRRQSPTVAARTPGGRIKRFYVTKIRPHITKKRLIIAGVVMFFIILSIPIATYAYFARDIGNRERLMNRNNTGIILKDRNGTAFYSSGVLSSEDDLHLDEISDFVEKATIASEDKDFYKHQGFSFRGTLRALTSNISSGDATSSGGSTITQQLVKNKLLSSDKNYLRKYQELSMAIAVDQKYSKEEILEMYLNSVYFGEGAFGISDAAKTYFNKTAADLTLAESSMLVGLLPAPSSYSPVSGDPELAATSQKNVLRKMVDTKAISESERETAAATPLTYNAGARFSGAETGHHVADMIVKDLEKKYGEERVKRSGFEVTTTIDLEKQKQAEQTIRDQIAVTAARGGRNAGMVGIDPKTGQVIALVGSVDYFNEEFGQVNMATALRQPGSSFKPIYYTEAIDRKLITAATTLNDKETTFGGTYTPKNYDNRYKGEMSTRDALAQSRNVPAVQVLQKVGINNAAAAAERMGISTIKNPQSYGLSFALGTAEVRLLEMTNAYAAYANQGMQYEPTLYTKVTDKYGKVIDEIETQTPKQVVSAEAAYVTSAMLSDQVARAPTFGSSLNISGRTVALKTGTTNDNRDAWTIGYTPSMVIGVWLGNNENEPMRNLAGGSSAGTIWRRIMTQYLSGTKRDEFKQPNAVRSVTVCSGTDLRSVNNNGPQPTRSEVFIAGTEPSGTCNEEVKIETPEPAPLPTDNNPQQPGDEEDDDNTPGTTPTTPGGGTPPTTPTTPGGPGTGGGRGSDGPTTPPSPGNPRGT